MNLGRSLGQTGVELPPPAPGTRSWQFLPTAEFASARRLFAALPRAIEESQEAIPTAGELEQFPEAEREQRMREIVRTDARMMHFMALSDQLDALELVLLDAQGVRLEAPNIGVTELEIAPDDFRDVLSSIDADADLSAALTPPIFLLVTSAASAMGT